MLICVLTVLHVPYTKGRNALGAENLSYGDLVLRELFTREQLYFFTCTYVKCGEKIQRTREMFIRTDGERQLEHVFHVAFECVRKAFASF